MTTNSETAHDQTLDQDRDQPRDQIGNQVRDQSPNKDLASACAERMHETDYHAQRSGITIVECASGRCELTMLIRRDMLNGFGSCHGGMIFSLADTAFAYACNSRNEANVAMDCRIDFLKPAFEGDILTAKATEVHRGKQSGLYSIMVSNQSDRIVAQFSGRSYYVNKPVLIPNDGE